MPEALHATLHLGSLDGTRRAGLAIGAALPPRAILLFFGEMGAGKTTMIKSICEGLGIPPATVISPTYTLVNIYPGPLPVFHADLLRLESPLALTNMDRGDWLNPGGPTLIEWPQAALPWLDGETVLRLDLAHSGDHERELELNGPSDAYGQVFAVLEPLRSTRVTEPGGLSRSAPR